MLAKSLLVCVACIKMCRVEIAEAHKTSEPTARFALNTRGVLVEREEAAAARHTSRST